jgi:hypothetical protein
LLSLEQILISEFFQLYCILVPFLEAVSSLPFLEASSLECMTFTRRWWFVCQAALPCHLCWRMLRRWPRVGGCESGRRTGKAVRRHLYGAGMRLATAWVAALAVWAAGQSARSDASLRARSDVMSGWRPQMSWCDARGMRLFALCSLGCGWTVRAALQLEREW